MDAIRIATPEQIEAVASKADLTPTSTVLAFGKELAVLRQVTEIDPVFFDEGSDIKRRMLFIWGMENMLRMVGVPEYYFNIHADEEAWKKSCETWGAKATSTAPEFRMKKAL